MNHIINREVINQIQLSYTDKPLAIFILGPNGSGKSTLRYYLNLSEIQTNIDPDVLNRIYYRLYPENYQRVATKAALKMYAGALTYGLNLCMESTLAGYGTMKRIRDAKAKGYAVIVYFVGLNSVELNLARVQQRVANGGHNIPENIIRKRYVESINNLKLIQKYCDVIHVLDNSDSCYRIQFTKSDGKQKQYTHTLEPWASELISHLN